VERRNGRKEEGITTPSKNSNEILKRKGRERKHKDESKKRKKKGNSHDVYKNGELQKVEKGKKKKKNAEQRQWETVDIERVYISTGKGNEAGPCLLKKKKKRHAREEG